MIPLNQCPIFLCTAVFRVMQVYDAKKPIRTFVAVLDHFCRFISFQPFCVILTVLRHNDLTPCS